jgi:hypothetical protein
MELVASALCDGEEPTMKKLTLSLVTTLLVTASISLPVRAEPPTKLPLKVAASELEESSAALLLRVKELEAKASQLKALHADRVARQEARVALQRRIDAARQALIGARESRPPTPPARVNSLQVEVAKLEAEQAQLDAELKTVEQRLAQVSKELDAVHGAADTLHQRVAAAAVKEKAAGKGGAKGEAILKEERAFALRRVSELLWLDPTLRLGLTPAYSAQLKRLTESRQLASEQTQVRNNDQQQERDRQAAAADDPDAKAAARDRRKAGLDSLQKFIDLIRALDPQIL